MRLFRFATIFAMVLGIALSSSAQTPAPGPISAQDQAGIDTTLTAFGTTLEKMDFDTFGTLFTEDCDFVNIVGMHWSGKAQVVKAHRIVFTTRYHGVGQHIGEKTEGVLAPGLVLVTSIIKMDDYTAQDGKRMTDNQFRMTWIMEKQGDRWLIRSAHNTVIDLEAARHDPGLAHAH